MRGSDKKDEVQYGSYLWVRSSTQWKNSTSRQ